MMSGEHTTASEFCYDIPLLLQLFESLGENCDFGVVQRAVGVEPIGLFRFAACDAANVAALLRTRFQPLGEPEDLWLEEVGLDREYCIRSRHFTFKAHTDRFAGRDDPEVVRTAEVTKMRVLKARLIRDLSRARRLFVYKGDCDITLIQGIVAGLQEYGPNCLLWVKLADAEHPAGSVIRISDGLLLGFVDRSGNYDGDPSVPVEDWIAVCINAYRFWRETDPPKTPLQNLIAEATATQSCYWVADPSAITSPISEAVQTGAVMLEHRLREPGSSSVCHVHLPITAGGSFVFSAWVRIPEGFRGAQISAELPGVPSVASWKADMKCRERWQRVWGIADVPGEARDISCGIFADGNANDVFYSACWCLERGTRPLGYGFDR